MLRLLYQFEFCVERNRKASSFKKKKKKRKIIKSRETSDWAQVVFAMGRVASDLDQAYTSSQHHAIYTEPAQLWPAILNIILFQLIKRAYEVFQIVEEGVNALQITNFKNVDNMRIQPSKKR